MSAPEHLTEQQKKWMASVREGLESATGKPLAEWVAVARTCSFEKPRERQRWLKDTYGVGQNYAILIFEAAFPSGHAGWGDPAELIEQLWTDPELRKIYDAVVARAMKLEGAISGPGKTFSAFARKYQFAALRPHKDAVRLGLAVEPDASPRLQPAGKEGWSERLHSVTVLATVKDVDADIGRLLAAAWERS